MGNSSEVPVSGETGVAAAENWGTGVRVKDTRATLPVAREMPINPRARSHHSGRLRVRAAMASLVADGR